MLPDRVSNPGPLTYESDALPIALRGPASIRISIRNFRIAPYDKINHGLVNPGPVEINSLSV